MTNGGTMAGGRQKGFVQSEALHAAMLVFWKQGYVGASLVDLTKAMGINKPSMYATFGNKEQLFVAAANYYLEELAMPHIAKLHQSGKPLLVRLKDYLMSIAEMVSDPDFPGGCFVSMSASEAAGETLPGEALAVIAQACSFTETHLQEFFENEIAQGNVGKGFDARSLTLLVQVLLHGNAAMARSGASLQDSETVFDMTLSALAK